MTDAYRHRRLGMWSLREGGRVVGHVSAVHLTGCRLVASEPSRQRLLATRRREVHAWVRGVLTPWCEPPADAVAVGYRPFSAAGFRTEADHIVTEAEAAWLTPRGRLWVSSPSRRLST